MAAALAAPELPASVPDGLVWLRCHSHRARQSLDRITDPVVLVSFDDDQIHGVTPEMAGAATRIKGVNRARLKPVRYFHPWR